MDIVQIQRLLIQYLIAKEKLAHSQAEAKAAEIIRFIETNYIHKREWAGLYRHD